MSRRVFAEVLGVKPSTVKGWELGIRNVYMSEFIAICDALDGDTLTNAKRFIDSVKGLGLI